jgi:ATP-dependent exoDNAse (exonuclease V) alpha subunit
MNKRLQARLNYKNAGAFMRGFKGTVDFRLHDKVMQTVNDYDKEVHNGDVGMVG